jgi:tetratricopeptide (TPR) repeat protein
MRKSLLVIENTARVPIKKIRFAVCMIVLLLLAGYNQLQAQQMASADEAFHVAFSAAQHGDYQLAVTNYNLAIRIDPSRNYFYYNRGLANKALGNTNAAMADFQRSKSMKITAEACYQVGIIKYMNGDLAGAKAELIQAHELREDLDNMNFYLGLIYFKDKQFDEALKCFEIYTTRVKTNADAYYYRGYCEAKAGNNKAALLSLKMALIYKDRDWKFYYKMYEVYMALGDKQNAFNNISMIIEMGERKPEYYQMRAALYSDLGDDMKAKEDLDAAQKLEDPVANAK